MGREALSQPCLGGQDHVDKLDMSLKRSSWALPRRGGCGYDAGAASSEELHLRSSASESSQGLVYGVFGS